jgi:hypothetical protein
MECNQIVPLLSASPDEHQTSMNNAEETINENEISIPNNNNSYPLLSQSKTSTV